MLEWVAIETLRTRVGLDATDASRDPQLEQGAALALTLVESWLDRKLLFKDDERETLRAEGGGALLLHRWPVTRIDMIAPAGIGAELTHWIVDEARGTIHLRNYRGPVYVEYAGGFYPLPADLEQAIFMVFDRVWSEFAGFAAQQPVLNNGLRRVQVTGVGSLDYENIYARASFDEVNALGAIPALASGILAPYRRETRLGCG
jgi:hypothetical protein